MRQGVSRLLNGFLQAGLLAAIIISMSPSVKAQTTDNAAPALAPPAADVGQALTPQLPKVPSVATPANANGRTSNKIINNPFVPGGVTDSRTSKDAMSREEVTNMMQQMETRLTDQIQLQGGAQQNVDTEQLTTLLGSLGKTEALDEMVFIGCVNGRAIYRTKDGGTSVVDEKSDKKDKKSLVVNRCQQ